MREDRIIEKLNSIVGHRIMEINYVMTIFHYPALNGDWTKVHPDSFVLHGKEWQLKLADGQCCFLTNPKDDLLSSPMKSNITMSDKTFAETDDTILSVPNDYYWKEIIGKKIIGFRFWRRVFTTSNKLGLRTKKNYQDNIQIIQLLIEDKIFSITTMNGDIGENTFYPTGYLGDRLGIFFDKQIADLHSVNNLTMEMELTYDSTK